MRKLPLNITNNRRLKSMTGLDIEKYEILLKYFTSTYEENKAKSVKRILKKSGVGRKGALPSIEIKLLFILYYLKAYPTFDILGDRFGMSTSKANEHLHRLMPILQLCLLRMKVMPKRKFSSPEELKNHLESLGGIETLLIDATEREHFRYEDTESRDALYSGKKKSSRLKTQ